MKGATADVLNHRLHGYHRSHPDAAASVRAIAAISGQEHGSTITGKIRRHGGKECTRKATAGMDNCGNRMEKIGRSEASGWLSQQVTAARYFFLNLAPNRK